VLESRLLDLLAPTPVAEDALIRDLALPAAAVAAALIDLELAGRIRRHPGGLVGLAV
jgi:DNA processing protein